MKSASLLHYLTSEINTAYLQTAMQVPAPHAGIIEELLVPDGGKVEGGTPLFKLRKIEGGVYPARGTMF